MGVFIIEEMLGKEGGCVEHGDPQSEDCTFVRDTVGSGWLSEHLQGFRGVVVVGTVVEVEPVCTQTAVLYFYAPLGVDQQVIRGQCEVRDIVLCEMRHRQHTAAEDRDQF